MLLCISDTSSSTPARPAVTQSTRRRWLRVSRGAGSSSCPNRAGGRAGSGDRRRAADGRRCCSSFLGPSRWGRRARAGDGVGAGSARRRTADRRNGRGEPDRPREGGRGPLPRAGRRGAGRFVRHTGGGRAEMQGEGRGVAGAGHEGRAGARVPASGEPDEDGPVGRGVRHGQATHLGRPERAERLDHDGLAAHSQGDLQRPGRQRCRRDGGDATAGGQGNQLHAALRWAGIDIGMIDVAVRKIFITPRTWITVRSGVLRGSSSSAAAVGHGPPDRVRSGRLRHDRWRVDPRTGPFDRGCCAERSTQMQVRRARGSILAALLGLAVLPAALPLGLPVGRQAVDVVVDISGAAGTLLVVRHAGTAPVTVDTTVLTGPAVRGWWVDGTTGAERRRRRADPGSGRHASSPGHRRRCRPRLDARDRRHDPRSRAARLTPCSVDRRSRWSHARRRGHAPRVGSARGPDQGGRGARGGRVRRLAARAHRPALPALRRRRSARRVDGRGQPSRARRVPVPPGAARPRRRAAGDGRHDLAHLLDDEADHVGRGHDALRAGRAGADRPGGALHPVLRRRPRRTRPGRR